MKKRSNITSIIIYIILGLFAIVMVYPFYLMIINSFKSGAEILNSPFGFPHGLNFQGYELVFTKLNMLRLFGNSLFVAICCTVLNVFFAAMVAFGLTKTELPGRGKLLALIISTMTIPGVLFMIPNYTMMYHWGWVNTYLPLIIPGCVGAFNIFLVVKFLEGIDKAYMEAAKLDGASDWQIFYKIVLPMSVPVLTTIGIFTFIGTWNDFQNPLLYLRSPNMMTVQLAVFNFNQQIPGQYIQALWAAFTVVTVPIVVLYLICQKQIIRAFTNVGLK